MSDVISGDDTPGRRSGFELIGGHAEVSIAANIERSLEALIPAEIRRHPVVTWLWGLRDRFEWARERDRSGRPGDLGSDGIPSLLASALLPVLQARIDLLAQSLYAISRMVGVSERAIDLIEQSDTTRGTAISLGRLEEEQRAGERELRTAVRDFLPDLLADLHEAHVGRHGLAMRSFDEWAAAAEDFRSVFQPAERALSEFSGGFRREMDGGLLGAALIRLVLYLSRPPRIGGGPPVSTVGAAGTRDLLVLSPGEAFGLVALAASVSYGDERDWHYGRDRTYLLAEIASTLRTISQEPFAAAELALLEQNIADFDPFVNVLSGPPDQSLQTAMRGHILSNREKSPWLREFLNRVGDPLPYSGVVATGNPADVEYINGLAGSARATILHALLTNAPHVGETWDDFLDQLFRDEWLTRFRRLIKARENEKSWSQESFVRVGIAVRDRLRAEGYPLSASENHLVSLWQSS